MIAPGNEKVIDYFMSELHSLRQRAELFSQDYSEVAHELQLGSGRSDDPHVEMLLQSFAYMTARLRYNMDADLPEVPTNLLKHLYPHLETPVPSMGVVQINPFPDSVDFTEGYPLQRERLFKRKVKARDNQEYDCYLRNAYDTKLWPVAIKESRLLPTNRFEEIESLGKEVRSVLHLKLESTSGVDFNDLKLDDLRLFINAEKNPKCFNLYDRLHSNLDSVVCGLPEEAGFAQAELKWLGFDNEHAILPYSKRSHPGYRLLQEYFSFPEKFLFFDVKNIQSTGLGTELDLYFLFNIDLSRENIVDEESLLVNCVPLVNLYGAVTEPVKLDQKEFEYLLVPDIRQYRACEIHSIRRVVGTDVQGKSTEITAFLPEQDVYRLEDETDYWSSRRDFPERKRFPGTETFISFHDQGFNISLPASDSVYAEVICTNRDLVRNMRIGTQLRLVGEGPANHAVLVTKPTRYREPAVRGKQPWELVSHLTLNFSTLGRPSVQSHDADSVDRENVLMIQNMLRMYCEPDNLSHQSLVDSVLDLRTEQSVAHTGKDAWRGFTQGMKISMTVDEARLDQTSVYLLGEIFQRFFALYTTINSFVSLELLSNQRDEAFKTWPPMTGEKALL